MSLFKPKIAQVASLPPSEFDGPVMRRPAALERVTELYSMWAKAGDAGAISSAYIVGRSYLGKTTFLTSDLCHMQGGFSRAGVTDSPQAYRIYVDCKDEDAPRDMLGMLESMRAQLQHGGVATSFYDAILHQLAKVSGSATYRMAARRHVGHGKLDIFKQARTIAKDLDDETKGRYLDIVKPSALAGIATVAGLVNDPGTKIAIGSLVSVVGKEAMEGWAQDQMGKIHKNLTLDQLDRRYQAYIKSAPSAVLVTLLPHALLFDMWKATYANGRRMRFLVAFDSVEFQREDVAGSSVEALVPFVSSNRVFTVLAGWSLPDALGAKVSDDQQVSEELLELDPNRDPQLAESYCRYRGIVDTETIRSISAWCMSSPGILRVMVDVALCDDEGYVLLARELSGIQTKAADPSERRRQVLNLVLAAHTRTLDANSQQALYKLCWLPALTFESSRRLLPSLDAFPHVFEDVERLPYVDVDQEFRLHEDVRLLLMDGCDKYTMLQVRDELSKKHDGLNKSEKEAAILARLQIDLKRMATSFSRQGQPMDEGE